MALYRLEAKIVGRGQRGRSVVAAAAYRNGTDLRDDRAGMKHYYSRRTKGVVATTILAPRGAPSWVYDSETLWNKVEAAEKRVDAQLAREFILAVPRELTPVQQFTLAMDWVEKDLVGAGMVAEVSLHHPISGKNPHVHVLCTMRKLDGEEFSRKKPREWNEKKLLLKQRESWANAENAALEKAGSSARVDHRSLKARGIDRVPEPKIGTSATAMKKRGVDSDPRRYQLVRYTKLINDLRPFVRSLEKLGKFPLGGGRKQKRPERIPEPKLVPSTPRPNRRELEKDPARFELVRYQNLINDLKPYMRSVEKIGRPGVKPGRVLWLERSRRFMSRLRDRATDKVKETWRSLVENRRTEAPPRNRSMTR